MSARQGKARKFLSNVVIAALALAAALCVAELAIRRFVSVRHVGPPVTTYDSIYKTRLKRNFSAVQITPEFRMRLTTNSMGYRAPEPAGPLKGGLLYLGDSFTVGYGVNDGQEYPAIVARRLAERGAGSVPYINAGRGNTGQSQWIKFLRREAAGYDPSFVIVQINETDFTDNLVDGLLHVGEDGTITELPLERPSFGRIAQRVMDAVPFVSKTYLYGLVRQAYFTLAYPPSEGPPDPTMRERQDRLLLRLLEEVDRLCDEGGWPVVALRVALDSVRDARVDSMLTAHAIPSRRIAGLSELSDSYYAVDGHWTAVGHHHAANTILELLAEADSAWLGRLKAPY